MKLYDKVNNRLIFLKENATSKFWDTEWNRQKEKIKYNDNIPKFNFYLKILKKHLPNDSKIIEGGCGLGYNSWYWYLSGYDVTAVDYAEETIEYLKLHVPKIKPTLGNVFKLDFKDSSFDGYWSIGVIEHFWNGYDGIQSEITRVLKPQGKLFLTFPHLSKIRRLKIKLNFYKKYNSILEPKNFYQFALDENKVIKDFTKKDFRLIKIYKQGALKGLSEEISWLSIVIKKLKKSNNILIKLFIRIIDRVMTTCFSHNIVIILEKK